MTSNFVSGKTAVIVIHGIGEQNPFDTLDSFARGLLNHYREHGTAVKIDHLLTPRSSATGSPWIESSVRLTSQDAKGYLDVHEYYWAHMTEEEISVSEVMQWLSRTLSGAKQAFEEYKVAFSLSHKGWRRYWWRLNSMIWHLRVFLWMVKVLLFVVKLLGLAIPWSSTLGSVGKKIREFATPVIVGYIGDIAIYTTMDQKSRHYRLRSRIIAESQALVKAILLQKEGKSEAYDRVIIAGHSLGSVIAYDTLSRLNLELCLPELGGLPHKKIVGLITFGSPLDKIAFFFRERVGKDQVIRRQILDQLHSFRAKWSAVKQKGSQQLEMDDRIIDMFPELPWLNFHDHNDPVSGKLEFYTDVKNIELKVPDGKPDRNGISSRARWGVAHIKYWDDPKFFDCIIDQMLRHK